LPVVARKENEIPEELVLNPAHGGGRFVLNALFELDPWDWLTD
jgi:hypothetical protein